MWRSLIESALQSNSKVGPTINYTSLATIGQNGKPKNRTLVFRGFEKKALKFTTDLRSEKIVEIKCNPAAELCWYFPETREQFRISGTIQILDASSDIAKHSFIEDLSDSARATFSWPEPAVGQLAQALEADFPTSVYPRGIPKNEQNSPAFALALSNFALLLLVPEVVDHVQLMCNKRTTFTIDK